MKADRAAPDMRVKRLPADPGPAGWAQLLPERQPQATLAGETLADWIVIGAGFAGLSAARRLHQLRPDDRIVLLEASLVADGPAGRNSGFMIDLPHDLGSANYTGASIEGEDAQTRMNRFAIDFASDAANEYAMPAEAAVHSGKINAAATKTGLRHNRDYAARLIATGEAHEQLDAAAMRDLTGTGFYLGGLFTPGTLMLQPAAYVRALADGLVAHANGKVSLHERSPVVRLRREAGLWHASTPEGEARAPGVILAVNGHANSFGLYERRLLHVFTYASMTRAMTPTEIERLGGRRNWAATPADAMGTTVRRVSGTGGNRIVIRNRFTCDPSMTVSDARIARVARDHDAAFRKRFPMLPELAMEYSWGGRLCLSTNRASAFGECGDGLYSACCQNGLGTARGTFTGIMAAELACGTGHPMLAALAREGAPARLPPEPFTKIGANATLRWREWRSGAEL